MRVSRQKTEENRVALLEAASRLFRRHGIDGVGVADVAKAAGLTHGALYAHFASKEALAAEAFAFGVRANIAHVRAWAGDRRPGFDEYLQGLISTDMRDRLEEGCSMCASASEVGRQGEAVSASFTAAFEELASVLEGALETSMPAAQRRRLALAAVAGQVGAIAVSRAIAKTAPALSDEVLKAVREQLGAAHKRSRRRSRSTRSARRASSTRASRGGRAIRP
jgi:TetR/AcrR family transcriptional repressor of nem operon